MTRAPRRRPLRPPSPDRLAREARDRLAAHRKICRRCAVSAGHPGRYCDEGYDLAAEVTRAQLAASSARLAALTPRQGLW